MTDEHALRTARIARLRAQGIEPWPEAVVDITSAADVIAQYQEGGAAVYTIAGRLMSKREHGKSIFAHVQDMSGKIQIYLKEDVTGLEQFNFFVKECAVGDIVSCTGSVFKTKTGEVTVRAETVQLLSACLWALPEKYHGLTDTEMRYRQRYLDLLSNPESAQKFIQRSRLISGLREYLNTHGYIEVETPMLHPIPGGANARPFITHHNALDMDLYLRIAPELYLKRLVIGGIERVYEINRNFRNEGISTRHNPEFTMLEFYTAHTNYQRMLLFTQQLIQAAVQRATRSLNITYGDLTIDFARDFAVMTVYDAVRQYGEFSEQDLSPAHIDGTLTRAQVPVTAGISHAEKIYMLFDAVVEKKLIQPTFITQFPIEVSPLSRAEPHNPAYAARFELFVAGMEIANSYNELNDPFDQAARFEQQARSAEGGNLEAHKYDADYIRALEYGLPPTVGVGIGIDRLTMLATNTLSIKDVILFPTLRPV